MVKYLLLSILFLSELLMAQDMDFFNGLFYSYDNYKESSLTNRRFKQTDILPLIDQLKENFQISKVGESVQKRSIFLIKCGEGKTKIFLWSQMHGDESTATMAIFDILNFLNANDSYNEFRNDLLKKVTIYFLPMVNPDGAEIFQRRNDFDIDINRDAISQQTPEGRILKETFDTLKANFGFNLHDQSTLYSAGHTFRSAVLSFLAPAENYEKTIDTVRSNAIKLIGYLNNILSTYIPGHIAKYSDDFEPRAFGDNFQRWGTSTILIESGGWKDDPEKQFIRKLNYIALLSAFKSIADQSYKSEPLETYDKIPFNERDLMDLIIRNVRYQKDGYEYKIDIGINRSEISYNNSKNFFYKSIIEDIGDLSTYFGYEDYNLDDMKISEGKTYPQKFGSFSEIEKLNLEQFYESGFTNVILNSQAYAEKYSPLPINILTETSHEVSHQIRIGEIPNFIIKNSGKVRYAVINGFLIDVKNLPINFKNGWVYH